MKKSCSFILDDPVRPDGKRADKQKIIYVWESLEELKESLGGLIKEDYSATIEDPPIGMAWYDDI